MPYVSIISVGENPRIGQSDWHQVSRPVYALTDFISLERARCEEMAIFRWMFISLPINLASVVRYKLSLVCPSTLRVVSEAMYKYDA